jgi:hypothetical protein
MAGNTQPVNTNPASSPLNPAVFNTLSTDPYATQTANQQTASFLTAQVYTTGTSTAKAPGASLRSFDFIQTALTGTTSTQ